MRHAQAKFRRRLLLSCSSAMLATTRLRLRLGAGQSDSRTGHATRLRQAAAQIAPRRKDQSPRKGRRPSRTTRRSTTCASTSPWAQPFRREMLTEAIDALDGQQIRIRGFILPTPQKRGIKQFVLVRDNQECCFGPGAALFDCILVEMQEGDDGRVHDPAGRRVTARSTSTRFMGPDGQHLAIYHIDGESVK